MALPADSSPLLRRMALGVFVVGAFVSVAALVATWRQPILDSNSFRQTQTAISAYWIGKGGSFWSYQTPVLGAPWSIPFEVPIYQAIVALVAKTGMRLDSAGRLVSWLFFAGTLWQVFRIVRTLGGSRELGLLTCGLLLLSPLYVFWSRTFMIESTALFFSVAFVSAALAHLRAPRTSTAVVMPVLATLAALVKVTTFLPFGLIGAGLVMWDLSRMPGARRDVRRSLVRHAPIAAAGLISLVAVSLWLRHADALKAENIFGEKLTSASLHTWNYGTWDQRLDPTLWTEAVFGHGVSESIGGLWVLLVTIAAAIAFGRRALLWLIGLAVFYVLPFVVFTNVQFVHHYYQYANALSLIVAVAVVIWHAPADWRRYIAAALIVLTFASQLAHLASAEWPRMTEDRSQTNTMIVRPYVRQMRRGVVLVFGFDWSSEVAYYGRHRSINVPTWTTPAQLEYLRTHLHDVTGGQPVAGIVECPHGLRIDLTTQPIFDRMMAEQTAGREQFKLGVCTVWR